MSVLLLCRPAAVGMTVSSKALPTAAVLGRQLGAAHFWNRLLDSLAQPHRDVLRLQVRLQPLVSQFAPHAALLHAAERRLRHGRDRLVDADDAGLDALG